MMMLAQFCHVQVLDHMALQPRGLLEAYGTGMNNKNEHQADPGQSNDVDNNIGAEVTYILV